MLDKKILTFQVQLTQNLEEGLEVQFQYFNFQFQEYQNLGTRQLSNDDDIKLIELEVHIPLNILQQKFQYRYKIAKRNSKLINSAENGSRFFNYCEQSPIQKEIWNKQNFSISFQTNKELKEFGVSFWEKTSEPIEDNYLVVQKGDQINKQIEIGTQDLLLQFYHYCQYEILYVQYEVKVDELDCFSNQLEINFSQNELIQLQNSIQGIYEQSKILTFKKIMENQGLEIQTVKNWKNGLTFNDFSCDKLDKEKEDEILQNNLNLGLIQEQHNQSIEKEAKKNKEQEQILRENVKTLEKLLNDDDLFIQQQNKTNEETNKMIENVASDIYTVQKQFFENFPLIQDSNADRIQKQNDDLQKKIDLGSFSITDFNETIDSFELKLSKQQKLINYQKGFISFQTKKLEDLTLSNGTLMNQVRSQTDSHPAFNQLQCNRDIISCCSQKISKSEQHFKQYASKREAYEKQIRNNLKKIQSLIEENIELKQSIKNLEKKIQHLEQEIKSLKTRNVKYLRQFILEKAKTSRQQIRIKEMEGQFTKNISYTQLPQKQQQDIETKRIMKPLQVIYSKPNFKIGNNQQQ